MFDIKTVEKLLFLLKIYINMRMGLAFCRTHFLFFSYIAKIIAHIIFMKKPNDIELFKTSDEREILIKLGVKKEVRK